MIQSKFVSVVAGVAFAAAALVSSVSSVRADVGTDALEAGKAAFASRSAGSVDALTAAVAQLEAVEGKSSSKEVNYDILVLEARALYFVGTHTAGDSAKKAIHARGQAKADAADALGLELAEAPYFAGVHLARWGEANGIVSSLRQVPTLKKYMATAMDRVTRSDAEGFTVDGYGPHRTLGRMFKKLPGLMGGSFSESVKHLEKAVKGDPTTALNVVYLADTLMKDGSGAEKARGKELLTALLAKDPSSLNADRVVETNEEFALAKQVLAGKDIQ